MSGEHRISFHQIAASKTDKSTNLYHYDENIPLRSGLHNVGSRHIEDMASENSNVDSPNGDKLLGQKGDNSLTATDPTAITP